MRNAFEVFERHAFRKPRENEGFASFNRSLFESWSVALASYSTEALRPVRQGIVDAFYVALQDPAYMKSISFATSNSEHVRRRFEVAARLLRECVSC